MIDRFTRMANRPIRLVYPVLFCAHGAVAQVGRNVGFSAVEISLNPTTGAGPWVRVLPYALALAGRLPGYCVAAYWLCRCLVRRVATVFLTADVGTRRGVMLPAKWSVDRFDGKALGAAKQSSVTATDATDELSGAMIRLKITLRSGGAVAVVCALHSGGERTRPKHAQRLFAAGGLRRIPPADWAS